MDKQIFLQTMKKYDYIMFDTNGLLGDDGVMRFLELVEREAVEHTLAPDGLTAACPKCGRELVCNAGECDFKSSPAGKANR